MSIGAWWAALFFGTVVLIIGPMYWWASNPQWSARAAWSSWRRRRRVRWYVRRLGFVPVGAVVPTASAGDYKSGGQMPPTEGYAEAVRRPATGMPRARTIAASASLAGRDGRPTRAMTALLGACGGAMLTVAWLHPLPSDVLSGHRSLYQAPAAGRLDMPNAKFGRKRLPLVVGTELPGLPGFWIDDFERHDPNRTAADPRPETTRQQGSGLHAPEGDGLPVLGGILPGRGGEGKAKNSGVVDTLRLLLTYFTYRYKYSYYRESTHIRIPPDDGVRANVDPYRGYIYREKAVYPVNHTYPPVIVNDFSGNSSSELPVTRSEGVSSGY